MSKIVIDGDDKCICYTLKKYKNVYEQFEILKAIIHQYKFNTYRELANMGVNELGLTCVEHRTKHVFIITAIADELGE